MYRQLLSVFICMSTVTTAPQDSNSDITYVKIQPLAEEPNLPSSLFRESRIENLSLTIPGNFDERNKSREGIVPVNNQSDDNSRYIRSEDATTSYESETTDPTEATTEKDESLEELIKQTEEYETKTKAPAPRFLSKLSYFQKANDDRPYVAPNFIERTGKRKFKSKCRCEKVWNCPKMQITVPRCPNDYFLCCG